MSFFQEYQGVLPLLMGPLLIALAAFVFKTARDRSFNLAFAGLYLLSGVKSIAEGVLFQYHHIQPQAPWLPVPLTWVHLSVALGLFMVPLFLLFVLIFPRPTSFLVRQPRLGILLFLPSALALGYYAYAVESGAGLLAFFEVYQPATVLVTILCIAWMIRAHRQSPDIIERRRAAYLILAFGLLVASNAVTVLLERLPDASWGAFYLHWVHPWVELLAAGTIGYAVVKYQLMGIELKVKSGLRYTLVAAVTVTIFFLGNNTFQKVIEPFFAFTELSYLLSALVATLVFNPIQRGSQRLMNRLFPATTQPKEEYLGGRARDIYHAQVLYILRDGQVTDRERRFLDNLAQQLGLVGSDAASIERQVAALHASTSAGGGTATPTLQP